MPNSESSPGSRTGVPPAPVGWRRNNGSKSARGDTVRCVGREHRISTFAAGKRGQAGRPPYSGLHEFGSGRMPELLSRRRLLQRSGSSRPLCAGWLGRSAIKPTGQPERGWPPPPRRERGKMLRCSLDAPVARGPLRLGPVALRWRRTGQSIERPGPPQFSPCDALSSSFDALSVSFGGQSALFDALFSPFDALFASFGGLDSPFDGVLAWFSPQRVSFLVKASHFGTRPVWMAKASNWPQHRRRFRVLHHSLELPLLRVRLLPLRGTGGATSTD